MWPNQCFSLSLSFFFKCWGNVYNVFSFINTVLEFFYSPFRHICVYEHRGIWGIESIKIINLINYLIMALVFHLPLWGEQSQNISFLKYSRYHSTWKKKVWFFFMNLRKLNISWIMSPNKVQCVSIGENDEYSLKICLHLEIHPVIFYFLLDQMAKAYFCFLLCHQICTENISVHCKFTIHPIRV